jgi:hypothetical protein
MASPLHDFAISRRVPPSATGGGFQEGRGIAVRRRLLPPLGSWSNGLGQESVRMEYTDVWAS